MVQEKEMQKVCESFLKEFANDKIKEAFNLLRPNTIIPESDLNKIAVQGIQQMQVVREVYGKTVGHELIKKDLVKDSLAYYLYMLKFENLPLNFRFIFYKGEKEWKLISIIWDEGKEVFFR